MDLLHADFCKKWKVTASVFLSAFVTILFCYVFLSSHADLETILSRTGYLVENADICRSRPKENRVVIMCLSRASSISRREVIRNTWAEETQSKTSWRNFANYTLVFVVNFTESDLY